MDSETKPLRKQFKECGNGTKTFLKIKYPKINYSCSREVKTPFSSNK